MGVQIPHGKGKILGENGRPIVKYSDTLRSSVLDIQSLAAEIRRGKQKKKKNNKKKKKDRNHRATI